MDDIAEGRSLDQEDFFQAIIQNEDACISIPLFAIRFNQLIRGLSVAAAVQLEQACAAAGKDYGNQHFGMDFVGRLPKIASRPRASRLMSADLSKYNQSATNTAA